MRCKLIGCEIVCRELCNSLARSPFAVDAEFLPKALHDLGGRRMREHLQAAIDTVDESRYDAILIGYGLCGNGTAGLTARGIPLVIPRAHDCIALLMGSAEAHMAHFAQHPGAYYRSVGWLERGHDLQPFTAGCSYTLDELIERYGEDNARYLYSELTGYKQSYTQLTYIRTGLEPDDRFERQAREEAARHNWTYEGLEGSLTLFEHLFAGDWNEREFVVVPPGKQLRACYDGRIMAAV